MSTTFELSAAVEERKAARPASVPILMLVLLGSLASFAFSWQHLVDVWSTGTFFDTDDAMRLVQVRALLSGQGWFDMTAYRLDPPGGVFMHWSRIVDVPLGLLIRFFDLFTSSARAELITRIVFPLSMQVCLVAAFLYAARALCGPSALMPALIVIVLSGFQFGQFVAGRIDHHAPQIVLLVTMTGAFVQAMRTRGRHALLCTLCIALSLGISLENLPFIAVLIAAVALLWLVRGEREAPFMTGIGCGLAVCLPLVFATTVSPSRYTIAAGDALSAPHVLLAILGGLTFVALAKGSGRLASPKRRIAALAVSGAIVATLVLLLFPSALTSPYADLDPVVRDVWISRVTEALPLPTTVRLHPQALTLVVGPLLAGLVATLVAVFSEGGDNRAAWIVVAGLTLVGVAGAFWEVRVTSSTMPIALLGGVWATTRALDGARGSAATKVLRSCALVLPFTPFAWLLVPVPEEKASVKQSTESAAACREASALTPLAALPQGLVFAPIDAGSHLLVHTPLSVVAAPYHRNNAGNRAVIDGFSAAPPQAEAIVKATGARYVVLCPGEMQSAALLAHSPDGLAAQLLAGNAPAWLHRLAIADTPYQVYSVQ